MLGFGINDSKGILGSARVGVRVSHRFLRSLTTVVGLYNKLGLVSGIERRLVYGVTSNDLMVYVQYI